MTLFMGKSQKTPPQAVGMNGKWGSGGGSPQRLFPCNFQLPEESRRL
jgi:hypothetical protein